MLFFLGFLLVTASASPAARFEDYGSVSIPSTDSDLSNVIGSPCATNVTNAWLDIVLVLDVSGGMTADDLEQLGMTLVNVFQNFTIGQTPRQSTRVAMVTYAKDYEFHYNLTDIIDNDELIMSLIRLPNYWPGFPGGDLTGGLIAAQAILSGQSSYRRQAVIVGASNYDPVTFNDASPTVQALKESGVTILSISFQPENTSFSDQLRNFSSPGYSYIHDDPDITSKISLGLMQVNCFCPLGSAQFSVFNQDYNNVTVYGDCLSGFVNTTDPASAESVCSPGILVSVTSEAKVDFIAHNIVPYDLAGAKNFTVGAFRENGTWYWHGYNNTRYPFGDFPKPSNDDGDYGYYSNYFGFNWGFFSGGSGIANAKPYVCQYRACDTDYLCNLSDS